MANLTWQQVVIGINCSIHCVWLQRALVKHKCLLVSYFTCVQNGLSAVYVAHQNGHTEVVDLLVQAGADIHLATTDEEVHVSTHTVSSSVAAVAGTDHTQKIGNMHC